MKKLMYWSMLLKSYAAMFFAGLIILYVVTGSAYAFISNGFEFSIPFVFVFQSAALSVVISVLWVVFFDDVIIKKMRYFMRLIVFSVTLIPVFSVCLWLFYAVFPGWTFLWVIIAGLLVVGLIIISLLFESYFKLLGRRYTASLKEFKTAMT